MKLYAWCSECRAFRRADTGDDPNPINVGRITEILRRHRAKWWHLRWCPGSRRDADPM